VAVDGDETPHDGRKVFEPMGFENRVRLYFSKFEMLFYGFISHKEI